VLWAVGTSSKPTSQHLFGGMDGSCLSFARSSQSLFSFFWARIAGTKLRQEDIIQGTKTRTRADQGHTQGVAPSSIPLWGRDLVVWARSVIPRRK